MTSVADAMRIWRNEPKRFVREVLRAVPDAWQDQVLDGLVHSDRVALKASKGPGKSTLLAWIGWWFLLTRAHPKVIATSITADNLKDNLWAEMSKWQQRSELLKAVFTWTSDRITCNDHPTTWFMSARSWPRNGSSEQQADTLAGVHADNVLFLLDEAGGIPDAVAAAAEGGLANASKEAGREAKLVIAGNPTHLEGPLYRACTSEAALWFVFEISGDPDDPMRAPRVSIEWARAQIAKYGKDDPFVRVNVFGKFPLSSVNALFGPDMVAEAMQRRIARAEYEQEVKIMGVDCARHGDDRSVIALRQGRVVFGPREMRSLDTMQLAGQVALAYDKHRPDALFIDQATFGMGTLDRLVQLGYPAIGIDFAGKPVTHVKYANRRSEMWFRMSEWVTAGGALPLMAQLVTELTAPTYKFDQHNHLLMEKKAEIKKRTGTSPDIADAIALTFAQPVLPRAMRDERRNGPSPLDHDPFEGA